MIDAHVHLPVGDGFRSWQEKKAALLTAMDQNHADHCIVIADSYPESEISSTDDLVSLFPKQADSRVSVVGGISPLVAFREGLSKIRQYLDRQQIVGIKLFPGHEPFYLTDARLTEVYQTAMQYQVPVLFHSGWENAGYGDAAVAAEILRAYPALRLVCCHCWYPDIRKCMQMIDFPNLFFDLSSVADDADTAAAIAEDVIALIQHAPDRVLFGSDSFGCSMAAHIRFVRSLNLSPETEQNVFANNAKRLYRL